VTDDIQAFKRAAALRAVEYVHDGMKVGLGTGTTTEFAVRELAARVARGLGIAAVPTSTRTERLARELGIPLTTLEDAPELDITIDGADEVDLTTLNAIKGLGGALLREKIVALASKEVVLIVDESKLVSTLGEHAPVPVEVVTFGWSRTRDVLALLGCRPERRTTGSGEPYITDSGNYLLDCHFPPIGDPIALGERIKRITGVVEHGLFTGVATRVVVGGRDGVKVVERNA
jgi:ribose 5-phosphate isomerase A